MKTAEEQNHGKAPRAARTTKNTTPPRDVQANTWKKRQFISPTLTEDQKKAFVVWAERWTFDNVLEKVLDGGYKITARWDDFSSAWLALLQASNEGGVNDDYILTQRARDPFTAMYRVLYVHAAILEGDWTPRHGGQDIDW